jgi:hypothetical protein
MRLYHFTSEHHLHGIARFGLTVGDVPTDIHQWKGRCGVWLTSNDAARGHGLEGSSTDKSRYRLMVEVDGDDPALVKWQRTSPPAPSRTACKGDRIRYVVCLFWGRQSVSDRRMRRHADRRSRRELAGRSAIQTDQAGIARASPCVACEANEKGASECVPPEPG